MRRAPGARLVAALIACVTLCCAAVEPAVAPPTFDGRPWNVSTGNASVTYIQASPIGAFPKPNVTEAPPAPDVLRRMRDAGLVAYEDYIAWGAVEREQGKWDWSQHDRMEQAMHAAGLKYVVYDWVHFPPVWLRKDDPRCTLMRCAEHGQQTNYLSVFDPRTIDWYDHFYHALHDHFGDRVDDVYACILGPYGEGNYPLRVPDWVDMGHCHEGYWCADPHALSAFRAAMRARYADVPSLNAAWGTHLASFDDVALPRELATEKFKPAPALFKTAQDRRRWLDFITWYHQDIVDFAERSLQTVLKYYPPSNVRLKPGGTAGGINPLPWGTYSPAYARMAKKYPGVVLQPADCQGAVFADKWLATAYRFYGVRLGTEPAGNLDDRAFARRVFSDASGGASQLFTYEFDRHAPAVRKYVHLYMGRPGDTAVGVLCPTTLYRLGGDLNPTIRATTALRNLCDFDVLDELLIADGALTPDRYKALILFQADVIDRPILDHLTRYAHAGGRILLASDHPVRDIEGREWTSPQLTQTKPPTKNATDWLEDLAPRLANFPGVDGRLDGIWTTRRGKDLLLFNPGKTPAQTQVHGRAVTVPPGEIWEGSAE